MGGTGTAGRSRPQAETWRVLKGRRSARKQISGGFCTLRVQTEINLKGNHVLGMPQNGLEGVTLQTQSSKQ
jgi:hypothetical protein